MVRSEDWRRSWRSPGVWLQTEEILAYLEAKTFSVTLVISEAHPVTDFSS